MVCKTDDASVRANVRERHYDLLGNIGYARIDDESKWIALTNNLQEFYCKEVGITSNDLWKRIDIAAGEFLDLEEFLYNR